MKITYNGKRIISPGQFGRDLKKSVLAAVDKQIRSAAPPGVKVRKTPDGYLAQGDAKALERMVKRLGK
ncbi:MAG: hypothetical protein V4530_03640 [Pseudomonadota bacterium]